LGIPIIDFASPAVNTARNELNQAGLKKSLIDLAQTTISNNFK